MAVRNTLFEYWKNEELRQGRAIEIKEIAKETGLHRETVANLLRGETTRFDTPVLEKICKFFNIPAGPVPFIVYDPEN